ncbi:hypothetical protein PG984_005480 [Apiospora sp. TS-2023a]
MSSFDCFQRLAPELRQMIWDHALHEEAESRLVIVHRPTMRVIPHPSLEMKVMNANQESREYAQNHFYKAKVKVRTLVPVVLSIPNEIASFASTPAAQDPWYNQKCLMGIYSGLYGQRLQAEFRFDFWHSHLVPKLREHVTKLLETPGRQMMAVAGDSRSGIKKGTLFLSPEHDRFAICHDYADVHKNLARVVLGLQQPLFTPENPEDQLLARHIADRLPKRVLQKIRRVVSLHAGPEAGDRLTHVCGEHLMRSREWKLRSFKGAHQLYTAHMLAVPNDMSHSQGFQNLLEWERVDVNGAVTFKCMCEGQRAEQ